ncbi:hypothetical protein Tco_1494370 [Tanacetum coccineum]
MGMFRCYIFTENRGCKFNKVQIRARVLTTFQLKKKKGDKADIRATNIRLQGPKRLQDSDYFKDKMLLMQAQENGAVLDEEQSSFLAGEQVTNVDDDVDDSTENDLALNVDHIFEADECDAFDSDVDEDHMDEYHDVHEMQNDVQHNYVVDSDADYTSDSNIIPYDQYVEDNEEHVVQCNASSVRNDALMSILDEMHEHGVQSRLTNKPDMLINDSVTSELARYKELVGEYEKRAKFELTDRERKIDEQMRIIISDRNRKETSLKSELHSAQILLSSTVDHYKSKTEEVKLLKKDFKQKEDKFLEEFLDLKKIKDKIEDRLYKQMTTEKRLRPSSNPYSTLTVYPPNTPVKLVPRILPTKSQVKINLYVLTQLFTEFDKTCKTRITPSGLTEGERGFEQTKRCYLTEVIPFFKTLKEHFVGVQTALFKEVKEMEKIFDQMNNEVDQNSVDKQLYVAKSRCLDLEADVSKVHDESKLISKLEREYLNLQKRKGVNDSTEASGSKPRSNTKKNRILPAKKENKKEVEIWKPKGKLSDNSLNKTKQIWKPKSKLSDNSLSKTQRVWKANGDTIMQYCYQWRPTENETHLRKLIVVHNVRPHGKEICLRRNVPFNSTFCEMSGFVSGLRLLKTYDGNRSKPHEFCGKVHRVYDVEGLGQQSILCRAICDSDLEVAFRKHTCFVRDLNGTDILKGSRGTNLYTISIDEMMKSSIFRICLLVQSFQVQIMVVESSFKTILHIGTTINDLARKDLVRGLPRLKFEKDHLCSACQLGKSKKFSHRPKSENTNMEVLHTLHMDLCGSN